MLPFSPSGGGAAPPRITVRVPAARPTTAQAPTRTLQSSAAPTHARARPVPQAFAASHVARSSAGGTPVGRGAPAVQQDRPAGERTAACAPNGAAGSARGRSGGSGGSSGGRASSGDGKGQGQGAVSWAAGGRDAAAALGCRPAAGANAGGSRGPGAGLGSWVPTGDAAQARSAGNVHRAPGSAAAECGVGDARRRSAVEPQRCYAAAPWPASNSTGPGAKRTLTLNPGEPALLTAQQQLLRAAAHWRAGREAAGRGAANPAGYPAAGPAARGLRAELQQYADPAVQRQLAAQAQLRERQAAEQVRGHACIKGLLAVLFRAKQPH